MFVLRFYLKKTDFFSSEQIYAITITFYLAL